MSFHKIREKLKAHIETMMADNNRLFVVDADGEELYDKYLSGFNPEHNPMYRERTEHDCSECRLFIKRMGNIVSIENNKIKTIWDFKPADEVYDKVFNKLAEHVKKHAINSVFLSGEKRIGVESNFETLEDKTNHKWEHFYTDLDEEFIEKYDKATKLNDLNTGVQTFHRALDEITIESVNTLIELSESNALYKGREYLTMLKKFVKHKEAYDKLTSDEEKLLYAWKFGSIITESVARIRNTAIGTLLVDISNDRPLDEAITAYERITAPANYKRSKPIFTQRMLDEAKKTIDKLGYSESLTRRFAVANDVSVADVLFANRNIKSEMKDNDIFTELGKQTSKKINPKKFDKVQEVSADQFLTDILPNADEIELYMDNKLVPNLVSLTAPENTDSKPLFKWNTGFSHVYNGNITDSMKELVAEKGGSVTGDLRFSIMWNESGNDNVDLDAHCRTINGEIYYANKHVDTGSLDVDIINPEGKVAVENITFPDRKRMPDGDYLMFVEQFSGDLHHGFKAEIEFDGQIYNFEYNKPLRRKQRIALANITLKNGEFTIKPQIDNTASQKEVWNIKTGNFIPVSIMCYSPNFWTTVENKTGHKHLMFMLKDCINPDNPSGIFNEYLVPELYEHRRVFEAMTMKIKSPDEPNQLSGVGFALDKRNEVVLKIKGQTERIIKVMF